MQNTVKLGKKGQNQPMVCAGKVNLLLACYVFVKNQTKNNRFLKICSCFWGVVSSLFTTFAKNCSRHEKENRNRTQSGNG